MSAQPGHDSAERTSQADLAGEGAPARTWWRRTPRVGVDGFRVVRRGYDPVQVHQLQQEVAAQTSILIADRDAALAQAAQLGQDLDSARGRIEQLCAQLPRVSAPDTLESFAERLEVIGHLAREEHAELRAECVADTAALITAAQPDLPPTSAAADPTASDEHPRDPADPDRSPVDRQRPDPTCPAAALENDLGHDREQRRARRAAAAQQALLDDAAAERREKAQEQLRMELALRCRETLTQLAAQHVQAVRTAELVLAQAHDTARAIVAQAQREVEQMHQVRAQLADELRTSRTLLEEVFARNQPTALTTATTTAATTTAAPSDGTAAASGRVASLPDLPDPPDDLPSHPSALGRMGGDGGDSTAAQPAAPTSAGAAR